jgi:hypothetical protein
MQVSRYTLWQRERVVLMHRHRFLGQEDFGPLRASPPVAAASAFMVCPLVAQPGWLVPSCPWQVYQLAYEQACAVVRPSRLERLEAASAN